MITRDDIARIFRSRTVWVAIGQAAIGIIGAVVTANPAMEKVGWIVAGKSVIDIWLRWLTTEPIGRGQP